MFGWLLGKCKRLGLGFQVAITSCVGLCTPFASICTWVHLRGSIRSAGRDFAERARRASSSPSGAGYTLRFVAVHCGGR